MAKGDRYQFTAETQSIKQVIEKPVWAGYAYSQQAAFESYSTALGKWEKQLASLPTYPADSLGLREDRIVQEGEDFEINYTCPACGGDGKETCNNPDHGFIDAVGGEIGRLGCPGCGHDPNHKVNSGRNTCPECGGYGHVIPDAFEEYGRENGYDEEPVVVIAPIHKEKQQETGASNQNKETEQVKEQSYFDECGNEIHEGDLIRVWHFRGRRRKVHYMYQIIVLQESQGKYYWGAKSYHVTENKGHYWLRAVANATTRIINGAMVIDTVDAMRELCQTKKTQTP